jgi:hypothetical protein
LLFGAETGFSTPKRVVASGVRRLRADRMEAARSAVAEVRHGKNEAMDELIAVVYPAASDLARRCRASTQRAQRTQRPVQKASVSLVSSVLGARSASHRL